MSVEDKDSISGGAARVGGNLAALLAARVGAMLLSLLQNAIIFRALSEGGDTTETGRFGYTLAYASFFTVFASLGIQRLLLRRAVQDMHTAWQTAWTGLAILGTLSAVCMIVIGTSLNAAGETNSVLAAGIWAAISVVLVWALQLPFEALIMARERMGLLSLVYALTAGLKVAAVAIAMPYLATAWTAHAAIAAANVVGFLLIVALAIKVCGFERPSFDARAALRQIVDSTAYTAAVFLSLLYFKSDLIVLKHLAGEDAAGQYTPIQRLMEPLLMVASLWGTALFPALCRLARTNSENSALLQATSLRLSLMLSAPMAIGLALLARPVVILLTGDAETYAPAIVLLRWLAFVIPFFYWNSLGQEVFYATGRNGIILGAYALAALVNIGINFFLIPVHGLIAIAYAALAANAAIALIFLVAFPSALASRAFISLILKVGLASGAMALAAWLVLAYSIWAAAILGAIAYCIALLLLRPFTPLEQQILNSLRQRR